MKFSLLIFIGLVSLSAFAAKNKAPVARISHHVTSGYIPYTQSYSGTSSYDPDGNIVNYKWDFFGNNTSGLGENITTTITSDKLTIVTLTVTDDQKKSSSALSFFRPLKDKTPPELNFDIDQNTVFVTSTPTITIHYSDSTSKVKVDSSRFLLNGVDVTTHLTQSEKQATLQFSQTWPLAPGDHVLRVVVQDYYNNRKTKTLSFSYKNPVISQNYVNGLIVNEKGTPLPGVQVMSVDGPVGPALNVTSKADGRFSLPFKLGGKYKLSFSKRNYLETFKFVEVTGGIDSSLGEVSIPTADKKVTSVSASSGGTATNSTGSISITVPANSMNGTKSLSFTDAVVGRTLQIPLPNSSHFTFAFNAQPSGTTFSNPASMFIQNTLGFPAGFVIPVGTTDDLLGIWVDSGFKGIVSSDRTKINFKVSHFSDVDVNLASLPKDDENQESPDPEENESGKDLKNCQKTKIPGSRIDSSSCNLSIDYEFPSVLRKGKDYSPVLTYSSLAANPMVIIGVQSGPLSEVVPPDVLRKTISWNGQEERKTYIGEAATKSSSFFTVFAPKNSQGQLYPTGSVSYKAELASEYSDRVYAESSYFGSPAGNPSNVLVREPVYLQEYIEGRALINNQRNSPFGAGWTMSGWERLHVDPDEAVVLMEPIEGVSTFIPISKFKGRRIVQRGITGPQQNLLYHEGYFYGADCQNNQVYRIDLSGKMTTIAGYGKAANLNCPTSIFPSRKGGHYVADSGNNRILYISQSGNVKVVAGTEKTPIGSPTFVTEDNVLAVHFIDGNEVKTISPFNGEILTTIGLGNDRGFDYELKHPTQIHYDDYHNLVVLDEGTGKIIKFYMNNNTSRVMLENVKGIRALARDNLLKRFFLLDNEGRVHHWDGWGKKSTRLLDTRKSSFKVFRGNKKEKDNLPFIHGLAYSPEVGLVTVSDEGLEMAGIPQDKSDNLEVNYLSQEGEFSTLTRHSDGTFERILLDKTLIHYDSNGFITKRVNIDGTMITYQHNAKGMPLSMTLPSGGSYSFSFDDRGYISSITDPAGRTFALTISGNGDLLRVTDPESSFKEFAYDADHHLTAKKDEEGEVTEYSYKLGRVVEAKYPGNRIKSIVSDVVQSILSSSRRRANARLDSNSVKTTAVSPEGREKTYLLGKSGAHHGVVDGEGFRSYVLRDQNSLPVEDSSPMGRKIYKSFDDLGRVTEQDDGQGEINFDYDPITQKVSRIEEDEDFETIFTYNSMALVASVKDKNNQVTNFSYNTDGTLKTITDPLSNKTSFEYDEYGNTSGIMSPMGQLTSLDRDAAGNLIATTDPRGNKTSFEYDGRGRMVKSTDAHNKDTLFTYWQTGQLKSLTDPKNQTTHFEINEQRLVSKVTNEMNQNVIMNYDKDSNMVSKLTKANQLISFEYDGNNRLTHKSFPGNSTSYNYDGDGLLIKATDADSEVIRRWNSFKQLSSETSSHHGGVIRYSYERGLPAVLTFKMGTKNMIEVVNKYDGNGNLVKREMIVLGKHALYQRDIDEGNRLSQHIYPNGIGFEFNYDKNGRPTQIETTDESDLSYNLNFRYNEAGNISSVLEETNDFSKTYRYEYDALNRMVKEDTYKNSHYIYDAVGNNTAQGGQYNPLNQLIQDTNFAFEYDLNGNVTKKTTKATGERIENLWNAENQRVEAKVFEAGNLPSKTIVYKYDALNRRIERSVVDHLYPAKSYIRKYVYDGEHILAILDGNNNLVTAYLHGAGVDDPIALITDFDSNGTLEVLSLLKDHLNSVRFIMDESQELVQEIGYSAYGETFVLSSGQANPKLNNVFYYTSRELEKETGDYYYRARYYDPQTGRFLSEDPLGFRGRDTNLYRYVGNNPFLITDPTGELAFVPGAILFLYLVLFPEVISPEYEPPSPPVKVPEAPNAADPREEYKKKEKINEKFRQAVC